MKTTKRLFCVALLVILVLGLSVSAFAAKGPKTYTVSVYGGNQGVYNGQDPYTVQVAYGDSFTLDTQYVSGYEGSMYYPKGFRVSGQDALLTDNTQTITQDTDFIVAYGVAGDLVEYTARYTVYGTGKQLMDPVTYYGNVGDKPVVAYQFIDGYRPHYENITATLTKEGPNVFTFEYIKIEAAEGSVTTNRRTASVPPASSRGGAPAPGAAAGMPAAADARGGAAAPEAPAPAPEAAEAPAPEAAEAPVPEAAEAPVLEAAADRDAEANTPPETEDVLDMDEPMAEPDAEPDASELSESDEPEAKKSSSALLWGVGGGVVVAGGAAGGIIASRRKVKSNA